MKDTGSSFGHFGTPKSAAGRAYLGDYLLGALHHVFREAFHHVRSPPRVRYLSDPCFLLVCMGDQHTEYRFRHELYEHGGKQRDRREHTTALS